MDVFVGRCAMFHVDVCMDMSLGGLCLVGCIDGCFSMCVVFGWMSVCMCW